MSRFIFDVVLNIWLFCSAIFECFLILYHSTTNTRCTWETHVAATKEDDKIFRSCIMSVDGRKIVTFTRKRGSPCRRYIEYFSGFWVRGKWCQWWIKAAFVIPVVYSVSRWNVINTCMPTRLTTLKLQLCEGTNDIVIIEIKISNNNQFESQAL